jgi:hypothetical protein
MKFDEFYFLAEKEYAQYFLIPYEIEAILGLLNQS